MTAERSAGELGTGEPGAETRSPEAGGVRTRGGGPSGRAKAPASSRSSSGSAAKVSAKSWSRKFGLWAALRAYGLVLVPLALVSGFLVWHLDALRNAGYVADERAEVASRMDAERARIEGRLTGLSLMLRGLEAAIEADPAMPQQRFASIARFLIRDNPEIVNIAAAPDLVVRYVYPPAGNAGVLGLDYRNTPDQFAAVDAARRLGRTIIAGPVKLVQNGESAFIVRLPVFLNAPDADSGGVKGGAGRSGGGDATRGTRFWGILSLVIDAQDFYRRTGLAAASSPESGIEYALRGPDGSGTGGAVFWGPPEVFADHPLVQKIGLPHGSWELAAIPRGGWATHAPDAMQVRAALIALALGALIAAAVIQHLWRRHRSAREHLARAIGAIDDGFALYDAEDRLVMCNQKYHEFYSISNDLIRPGVTFEEMIREGVRRGQYADAVGQEEAWIARRMIAHRHADSRIEQKLADGRWLRISERRTDDGWTVGFRVDITELKRAKDVAEEANRVKADFLSVLSHELRTPLTVILGFARFLSDRRISPVLRRLGPDGQTDAPIPPQMLEDYIAEVTQRAAKIETSGNHLLLLINDLLDFSKIEAGKMEMERESLPLALIVDDVIEQFRSQAESKGLALASLVGGDEVYADPVRLRQVLINLVGNAIKFTDAGGITLSAKTRDGMVTISVVDTGCGIPAEMTERVFREFQQADSSSTRRAGGTGLGLAIVRRIVELHGGKVTLCSVPGEGSTFTFTIPAKAGSTAARSAA
ncbi:ATP-binding protein [Acidimangrovimonas sediminis]|uniref:ATP-binding protein n=1 Tax=Acidimangrovimonas sediminis TaxID=2056283 RepID=UPI0011AF8C94|nr:ATP-binding protein [Acidimangrovimonas sediminis]